MPEPSLSSATRVLHVRRQLPRADRPVDFADDVCFSPDLVAAFVQAYTTAGDLVVDPFAGFGTTLHTAEDLGRRALGFEIDEDRVAFARARLADPTAMHQADVRRADWSVVPLFQLSITSPPYMTEQNHPQNPLSGYRTLDGDYGRYLSELQQIYRGLGRRAAGDDTRLVVNVANLETTRLAWNVGAALAEVLTFEREIVVEWDRPQDWLTQDYCLVFRPQPGQAGGLAGLDPAEDRVAGSAAVS